LSQTVSLSGDAFTWLALALLSYELNPARSAAILASALTLRVTAYIIFHRLQVLFQNVSRGKAFYG